MDLTALTIYPSASMPLPEIGRLGSFPRMFAVGDDNSLFPYMEVAQLARAGERVWSNQT
jgi:hypothetical protein